MYKCQEKIEYGGIPERPKGADCKSVAIASKVRILLPPYAQIAQSVEQRTENPRVAGSIPALGITILKIG